MRTYGHLGAAREAKAVKGKQRKRCNAHVKSSDGQRSTKQIRVLPAEEIKRLQSHNADGPAMATLPEPDSEASAAIEEREAEAAATAQKAAYYERLFIGHSTRSSTYGVRPHPLDDEKMGRTALHIAARSGDVDVCTALIASKRFQGTNTVGADGMSALHFAAIAGKADVCSLLIASERFAVPVDARAGNTRKSPCEQYEAFYGILEKPGVSALELAIIRRDVLWRSALRRRDNIYDRSNDDLCQTQEWRIAARQRIVELNAVCFVLIQASEQLIADDDDAVVFRAEVGRPIGMTVWHLNDRYERKSEFPLIYRVSDFVAGRGHLMRDGGYPERGLNLGTRDCEYNGYNTWRLSDFPLGPTLC